MVVQASATENVLSNLGFHNYKFDYLTDTILVNYYKPIMSYSSNGTHTTLGGYSGPRYFSPDYIQTQLNFEYAPGAVFNTAESFNATTLGASNPIPRRDGQGQIPEFFLMGGTVGVGHAYEPTPGNMVKDYITFPAYQLGYSFIEAAYMGMPNLTTENVVIGDPLCRIAWGKQVINDSLLFENFNLITGEIELAADVYLTDGTKLKFKHNGFITGEGYLIAQDRDYTLETVDWNKSVFKSKYNNHPMIIWAPYPGEEEVYSYLIYRKWESTSFEYIGNVSNEEFAFVDNELEIIVPEGEMPKNAQYYIVAALAEDNSTPSNQVEYYVDKAGKISTSPEKIFTYNLMQNYPNPFNPVTKINYSIAKPCLVTLKVYDILGREIKTLVNEVKAAGNYEVNFNAASTGSLASGMYIYKLTAGSFTKTHKMMLLK